MPVLFSADTTCSDQAMHVNDLPQHRHNNDTDDIATVAKLRAFNAVNMTYLRAPMRQS